MKRGGPLRRLTALRRSVPLSRSKGLRPFSPAPKARTAGREPPSGAMTRAEVRAQVVRRDGFRCQLWWHSDDCWGPLDVHEVVRRSQHPGAHLDPGLCLTLCRGHHGLDAGMAEAELLGIRVPGGVYERYGETVVLEAAAIRAEWARGGYPPRPSWRIQPRGGQ